MILLLSWNFRFQLYFESYMSAALSGQPPNRPFKFDKSSQLFIRTHNKTLVPVAVSVSNEASSPARINARDAAPNADRLC
jgi:hypothetical protein